MEHKKNDRLRKMLAHEAAKIIATEGVCDFQQAKRKACERIGNSNRGSLPSNSEIEQAVCSFQHTFLLDHDAILAQQRKTALTIMRWLREYSPYLVGPVLEGTAHANTAITIHVSSDVVEEVVEIIERNDIDLKIEERRLKFGKETAYLPTIVFFFQENEIAVTIFTLRQQHQVPKSKIKNRSLQRMNLKNLENLLAKAETSDRQD